MMKKQILLFITMLLPLVASADAVEIDGIYYNLVSEGQAEVTGNPSEYSGEITIPESVEYDDVTYSVTSIGDYAFFYCMSLTSIEIPNSVTSIGGGAFYYCTGLTSVTIGNKVTSIGDLAFGECYSLTSVTIPNSVTSIGDYAFDGTPWYNNQPDGLIYVGKVTYKYKGTMPDNTSITIKDGTLGITSSAFEDCTGLTSIEIPNSVTSIGDGAFDGCSGLTAISIENGNPKYDTRDNCNAIIETSSNTLIAGCKTTIIPNSVTSIGDLAFYRCTGLTSIEIPNSVTSIGTYAFSNCSGLTSIEIPNSVTSIGGSAFSNCTGLTSIEIPNSVTSIGEYAFYKCYSLTSVTIPNSVTSIGREAFRGCSSLTSIEIPNSVTSIGYAVFDGTPWYNNQPDGLIYAGMVVYKYKGTMPDNTNITIKEGTLEIVGSAFEDCTGLTSIEIPNSVTSIGSSAFEGCSGLTSVTIPNSVTSIGEYAFQHCTGLTSVTIGNSVTRIGYAALYECNGLTSVSIKKETPLSINQYTFSNRDNATLYVPYGCKAAYEAADYWKEFKEIIEIGEIGDADGDGSVDVNDVTSTINHILNKPVASFYEKAADVDGDGVIDVNDVQGIIDIALGKVKTTEYYYYVGPENPMNMTSISPIVTSQAEAGWYKIGTSIGTYSLSRPLLDASENMIPMGSKTNDYIALPNSTLKIYNGLGISEMDAYTLLGTKVFDGVTYYIYQDNTAIRYFSQFIY